MPRKPQKILRKGELSWQDEYMCYGYYTLPSGKKSILKTLMYGETPLPAWEEVADRLLLQFIQAHPCSRPFSWWEEASPEPRRRMGGEGEISESRHSVKFGVPAPNTWWKDIDPDNPPIYESQASYLQRHGLLTKAEQAWLKEHREAFEPEKIGYLTHDATGKIEVFEPKTKGEKG